MSYDSAFKGRYSIKNIYRDWLRWVLRSFVEILGYRARKIAQGIDAGEDGALAAVHGKGAASHQRHADGLVKSDGHVVGNRHVQRVGCRVGPRGRWSEHGTHGWTGLYNADWCST